MSGLRRTALVLGTLVLAGVLASSAPATHGRDKWSGQWTTNTGGVGFRWVTDSEGSSALKSQGGTPCSNPTDYFRGGYYNPSSGAGGKITGCTVGGPNRLAGRYVSDSKTTRGKFDIKFVSPNKFKGTYRDDSGAHGPYTGVFKAHFAGDGANHGPSGGSSGRHVYTGRVDFHIKFYAYSLTTFPDNCSSGTPGHVAGHGEGAFNLPNGQKPFGGFHDADTPFLARCRTPVVDTWVEAGRLTVLEPGHVLRLRVTVKIRGIGANNPAGSCRNSTLGRITAVYDDTGKAKNGLRPDRLTIGPWERACGHNHVITNNISPIPAHGHGSTWVVVWIGCHEGGGASPKFCK